MSNRPTKLLISLYIIISTCYGSPTVTISQGVLEGANLTAYGGRTISAFMGIPYAEPPLGDLRFKAPEPASSWNGTYSATNETIECTQLRSSEVVGGEDCLYLNVYTPQLPESNATLLPVMVYVHGGAFITGSSKFILYGPQYIMDYDVVLVMMNYRLGVLGFLTTGDEEAPGNFGLKDQILALRWVQDNVAAFGGDPDQVTLFGNSAGSASIHFLTLSDLTEGLFHKFILQSGTALSRFPYRDRYKSYLITTALAESFNCSTDSSSIIVQCLREQDAASLMSWTTPVPTVPTMIFVPTNEPESDEAVISEHPKSLMEQGKMKDLPWMTGFASSEGLLKTASYYFDEDQWDNHLANLNENVDAMMELLEVDDATEYTNAVMEYYFNDLTVDKNVILENYTDFIGDFYFYYPTADVLQAQTKLGTQPVYMYLFDYQGTYSISYAMTGNSTLVGTCHSDEELYLFLYTNPLVVPVDANMTETDLEMMKRVTGLWTSFAINGVPTLTGVEDAEEWLEYGENKNFLNIGNKSSVSLFMDSALFEDRMQFWSQLVGSLNSAGSRQCSFHVVTLVMIFIISFIFIK